MNRNFDKVEYCVKKQTMCFKCLHLQSENLFMPRPTLWLVNKYFSVFRCDLYWSQEHESQPKRAQFGDTLSTWKSFLRRDNRINKKQSLFTHTGCRSSSLRIARRFFMTSQNVKQNEKKSRRCSIVYHNLSRFIIY